MPKNLPWFPLTVAFLVLVAVSLPFLYASQAGGEAYVFGGFLLNPLDGNSYLAKMYQGWEGNWRYQLAFSAEPGQGAYLFLFYLFLGHVARLLNAPLLVVFHFARLLSAMILLAVLWRFYASLFPHTRIRRWAYALSALGSGIGWLLLPLNSFTADFWVAETYPFLSTYANPHFSLGLALVLWHLIPVERRYWLRSLTALFLGIINPFGVVIVAMVLGGMTGLRLLLGWLGKETPKVRSSLLALLAVLVGGLPVLLYDVWVTSAYPAFAAWNAQNLTPSPPWWDVFISLSPALVLALLAVVLLTKESHQKEAKQALPAVTKQSWLLLAVWAGLGLILLFLPFSLQRRFMMGLYVPVAGLAVLGMDALFGARRRPFHLGMITVLAFSLLTNVIVVLTGLYGARTHDPHVYLTAGEAQALTWIGKNTAEYALIVASPEMGMWVPAHTGRRVLYGHPFETVDAQKEEQALITFFKRGGSDDFLTSRKADYLFYGPREQALGNLSLSGLQPVYISGDVTVYRWGK